jgi:hypothetical protein
VGSRIAFSHREVTRFCTKIITNGCKGATGSEIDDCLFTEYFLELQSNVDEIQDAFIESFFIPQRSPGAGITAASIAIIATSVVDEIHLHCETEADGKNTILEQLNITTDSGTTEDAKSVGEL